MFQAKQCRNCHALGDSGGQRGPALDSVAVRLTEDQLIRQVIQGGGNMPAYGKNLSPAETTALVAFLKTLHPPRQAPARDASRAVVEAADDGRAPTTVGHRAGDEGQRDNMHAAASVGFGRMAVAADRARVDAGHYRLIYCAGWYRVRQPAPAMRSPWRPCAFIGGLAVVGRGGIAARPPASRAAAGAHAAASAALALRRAADPARRADGAVAGRDSLALAAQRVVRLFQSSSLRALAEAR